MTDLSQAALGKRLTMVENVGSPGDGDSLSGQNVNNFPDGALFYVRASHRMYELRKNLDALVVESDTTLNVRDGVGSSASAGRFVATQQWTFGTLSGGTLAIPGWDLTNNGFFLISVATIGGTPGTLHGAKTAANSMTVTSSSGSDTSTVVVAFLENPE